MSLPQPHSPLEQALGQPPLTHGAQLGHQLLLRPLEPLSGVGGGGAERGGPGAERGAAERGGAGAATLLHGRHVQVVNQDDVGVLGGAHSSSGQGLGARGGSGGPRAPRYLQQPVAAAVEGGHDGGVDVAAVEALSGDSTDWGALPPWCSFWGFPAPRGDPRLPGWRSLAPPNRPPKDPHHPLVLLTPPDPILAVSQHPQTINQGAPSTPKPPTRELPAPPDSQLGILDHPDHPLCVPSTPKLSPDGTKGPLTPFWVS